MITSKESLEELKRINSWRNNGNGDIWLETMIIQPIEKDLEVLEILKKLPFEIYLNGGGDDWEWFIDLKQSFIISKEQASKIKEWLEK